VRGGNGKRERERESEREESLRKYKQLQIFSLSQRH
jgi:hypothetical protein